MEKVLVAMSGGVDSSAAALLLKNSGFEVCGGMMHLTGNDQPKDYPDALAVAQKLGFELYLFDMRKEFRENVINRFIEEYLAGRTPNPCVFCNRTMKFSQLFEKASSLSCGKLATGHYARIEFEDGRFKLKRALDRKKDQSYFLYTLHQNELSDILFPLGSLTKEEIRDLAMSSGLINAAKHDSQDICFIPDGDYASFIERELGSVSPEGDFCDLSGNIIGRHHGAIRYTKGQRRGLGIAAEKPLYVHHKDPLLNRVYLSGNDELFEKCITVHDINLIDCTSIPAPRKLSVQIRNRHIASPAVVEQTGPDEILIEFEEPQRAPTSGQSAVFYEDDTVIGGGII